MTSWNALKWASLTWNSVNIASRLSFLLVEIRLLGRIFVGVAFEDFVDVGLVGLGLFGGEAAEFGQETWIDSGGDPLFGVVGRRAAHAAGAPQLFVRGL